MQTVKRYLISSLDTFLTGFIIGILPELQHLKLEDLSSVDTLKATIFGLVLVGVRAGFKAIREYITARLASRA